MALCCAIFTHGYAPLSQIQFKRVAKVSELHKSVGMKISSLSASRSRLFATNNADPPKEGIEPKYLAAVG